MTADQIIWHLERVVRRAEYMAALSDSDALWQAHTEEAEAMRRAIDIVAAMKEAALT